MLYVGTWCVSIHPVVNDKTYRDTPGRPNIQHMNAPEDGLFKSETC